MKGSGIGGQAVMEGVMMKNGDRYAVAVRKPDHEIAVEVKEYRSLGSRTGLDKVPILRGVLAFIDSLKLGIGSLTWSASFFEEEENKPRTEEEQAKKEKKEKAVMAGTVFLSVIIAIGIFMLLPYYVSRLLKSRVESETLLALLEGVIRVLLFIGYVAAISRMEDIKRVFRYHGAEHKAINCIENGLELTVENVRTQSRQHKRCGTSFLLIVMLISILFFMFIRFDSAWLRIAARIILIPVIAGISYEFIKLAGRSSNKVVEVFSKPGLALQRLTTAEPDDSMIECAIASVEAVFDWKEFLAGFEGGENTEKTETDNSEAKDNAQEQNVHTDRKNKKNGKKNNKYRYNGNVRRDEAKTAEANHAETVIEEADDAEVRAGEVIAEENDDFFVRPEPVVQEEPEQVKEPYGRTFGKRIDLNTPVPDDEEEDDEILRALDQYFVLKQKDNKKEE